MADKPRHPVQVLARAQAELKLNVLEKVKHVPVKRLRVPTARRGQIVEVPPFDLRDCRTATPLTFAYIGDRQAGYATLRVSMPQYIADHLPDVCS